MPHKDNLILQDCTYIEVPKPQQNRTYEALEIQGMLQILDAAQFQQTIEKGIGKAKAFGLGMLMVWPQQNQAA